jgi:serine phosphatase RsbU (regulator of sigma subunit)
MLLGAFWDPNFDEITVQLDAGDLLILATDGVTEARSIGGDSRGPVFFGLGGVATAARRVLLTTSGEAFTTLASVGRAIVEAARDFGGGELADDACLLLARRQ